MKHFNKGDIVYFKEPHSALYSSGSHEFHPGPYEIVSKVLAAEVNGTMVDTCTILDLRSYKNHFIFNSNGGYDKLVTIDEWRDLQISKLS